MSTHFPMPGHATILDHGQNYNKISRWFIPFLLICHVWSYLDRIKVGFAKLQMLHDLGLPTGLVNK
jgi:hypothetical protein